MPRSIKTPGVQDAKSRVRRERRGRAERAAGREHVVHQDEAALAALHLQHARPVLERVLALDDRRRKLPLLAHRHEALAALLGECRGQDEAARLDARNRVGLAPFAIAPQCIERGDGLLEVGAQQRRDVPEQDSGLREIGDIDHESGERVHGTPFNLRRGSPRRCARG